MVSGSAQAWPPPWLGWSAWPQASRPRSESALTLRLLLLQVRMPGSVSLDPAFRRCRSCCGLGVMTEKCRCHTGRHYTLVRRVLIHVFGFGLGALLGVGHQQVGDVHNPLQLGDLIKEVQHGVIGAIEFNFERHLGIKLLGVRGPRGVAT